MNNNILLEHKINLRKKKIGFPESATARLYQDKIELLDKAGNPILNANLVELQDIKDMMGAIAFTHNGQFYSLEFFRTFSKMFGLIGMLLDGGIKRSKQWKLALQEQGFQVERKLF